MYFEHRDEAQGNKDTTKALILKAKQMKLRYCAISVYKNNSKKCPDPNFFDFLSEKKLRKNRAPFVGELIRSFSLPPTHTYVLDTKDIVRTFCAIKKSSKRGVFKDIQRTRGSKWPKWTRNRMISQRGNKKFQGMKAMWNFLQKVPVCRLMPLWKITTIFLHVRTTKSSPTEKNINTVKMSVSVPAKWTLIN